jgi:hypothetical protein
MPVFSPEKNMPVFFGSYAATAGIGSRIILNTYVSHTQPVGQIRKYPVKGIDA